MDQIVDGFSADREAMERLNHVFRLQKDAFLRDPYPTADKRIELLQRVPPMLRKNRQRILDALDADFGGHSHDQSDLLEILSMFERAKFNVDHVKKWIRPVPKASNPVTQGNSKVYINYHPKGVIGNMVAWNFPFDIGIGPMLDALAAGNCAPASRAIGRLAATDRIPRRQAAEMSAYSGR